MTRSCTEGERDARHPESRTVKCCNGGSSHDIGNPKFAAFPSDSLQWFSWGKAICDPAEPP